MGLYHDITNIFRSGRGNVATVNSAFTIFCVPDSPDSGYYSEVVEIWEEEAYAPFMGAEYEE